MRVVVGIGNSIAGLYKTHWSSNTGNKAHIWLIVGTDLENSIPGSAVLVGTVNSAA